MPGRYQRREKPDDDSADEHEQNACDLSNHLFIISLTERQRSGSARSDVSRDAWFGILLLKSFLQTRNREGYQSAGKHDWHSGSSFTSSIIVKIIHAHKPHQRAEHHYGTRKCLYSHLFILLVSELFNIRTSTFPVGGMLCRGVLSCKRYLSIPSVRSTSRF
jgi:hypothetical protein